MLPEISKILIDKFKNESRIELYDLMIEADALRRHNKFLHQDIEKLKTQMVENQQRMKEIYSNKSIRRENIKVYRELYKNKQRVKAVASSP